MDLSMPMYQKLEEQPLHAIRSDTKGEEMQYIQRYCYYFGSLYQSFALLQIGIDTIDWCPLI